VLHTDVGSAMRVFLLNLPRLEFAALIPKGDYMTECTNLFGGLRLQGMAGSAPAQEGEIPHFMKCGMYDCGLLKVRDGPSSSQKKDYGVDQLRNPSFGGKQAVRAYPRLEWVWGR